MPDMVLLEVTLCFVIPLTLVLLIVRLVNLHLLVMLPIWRNYLRAETMIHPCVQTYHSPGCPVPSVGSPALPVELIDGKVWVVINIHWMKILQRKFKYQIGDFANDSQFPSNCKIWWFSHPHVQINPSCWELGIKVKSRDTELSYVLQLLDLPIEQRPRCGFTCSHVSGALLPTAPTPASAESLWLFSRPCMRVSINNHPNVMSPSPSG